MYMKAVIYKKFKGPIDVTTVNDPVPGKDDTVIKVMASGICRSDWHGWMGHDPDITRLPHVPGHEFAGIVAECGKNVKKWKAGERITAPFVCACGTCPECQSGHQNICDSQSQPGFTHWGSFAEYVLVKNADINLVKLPDEIDFVTAASLGCRFATSFRAISVQGQVQEGSWVAIHGCGGVGLAAIMIAHALQARVIAVDIKPQALTIAKSIGADYILDANAIEDIPGAIHDISDRGVDVSLDALGSKTTSINSVLCLKKRGKHIQIGLLAGDDYRPPLPMEKVIANELEILGSHGMQAWKYSEMLDLILNKRLDPQKLVSKTVSIDAVPYQLVHTASFMNSGLTIIDAF